MASAAAHASSVSVRASADFRNIGGPGYLSNLHAAVSNDSAAATAGVDAGISDRYIPTVLPGTKLVISGQAQPATSTNGADEWTYVFNNALLGATGSTAARRRRQQARIRLTTDGSEIVCF